MMKNSALPPDDTLSERPGDVSSHVRVALSQNARPTCSVVVSTTDTESATRRQAGERVAVDLSGLGERG
jgi:hypothetical protein